MTVRLIHDWVRAGAENQTGYTAIAQDGVRLSYLELDHRSDSVAAALQRHGCKPGDRVGILMPKSPDAIVTMVGVLKAGAVYVPLDSSSPPVRAARILDSARPDIVMATAGTIELLGKAALAMESSHTFRVGTLDGELTGTDGLELAFGREEGLSAPTDFLEHRLDEQSPAHILFTSGSTGQPKGVVITHANVVSFVTWAVEYFGITEHDRVSGHAPLHFDLSTLDIYGAFAAGAELHPVGPELNVRPDLMAQFIRDRALTQWFSVPSVLALMARFDVVSEGDFSDLKRLMWCGEVFPTPVLVHFMERLPHVEFTNLYGPTEATIASSFYTVPGVPADPSAPVPIGRACDGERLLVLDAVMDPVPAGEIGRLFIGGVGLSPGYWEDLAKTEGVFVDDPRNPGDRIYDTGDLAKMDAYGIVHFIGRADTQIKSRGYRIELGEIEAALHALAFLDDSAVVAVDTGDFQGATICCAFVGADGEGVEPRTIRAALAETLPSYMMPARWQSMTELPKNANGKVDRPALKAQFSEVLGVQPTPASTRNEQPITEGR